MIVILAGMTEFVWGAAGTLATAAIIGIFAWAWHMNAMMTRLTTSVEAREKHLDERFANLQKEVESIKSEMSDIRRSVK